jgi:hypothetical protein
VAIPRPKASAAAVNSPAPSRIPFARMPPPLVSRLVPRPGGGAQIRIVGEAAPRGRVGAQHGSRGRAPGARRTHRSAHPR